MQPTEQQQPTEEELIAHIRQRLMAHEESYEIGAWERFNTQQRPKKRPVFWIGMWSGAAIIALCFSVLLFRDETPGQKNQTVKTQAPTPARQAKPVEEKTVVDEQPKVHETLGNNLNKQEIVALNPAAIETVIPTSIPTDPVVTVNAATPLSINPQVLGNTALSETPAQTTVVTPQAGQPQIVKTVEAQAKTNIIDFLNKETEKDKANAKRDILEKRESRWELGLMVAPSFGNTKKLNMGYGLSMEYSLSDRLSLSSGIAYNEMTASKNTLNKDAAASLSTSSIVTKESKNLAAVSEKVVGLDIPLELKYHISKNIYANLGISAFAVFDYNRDNTYLEKKLVPNYVLNSPGANDPITGPREDAAAFTNSQLVNQRVTEPAPASDQKGSNYIGFYNFSVGYKKKISKGNAISIEPFMKLPMKEVNKDNLKLMGTGLRLKFDF